jgi:hypothetical protein
MSQLSMNAPDTVPATEIYNNIDYSRKYTPHELASAAFQNAALKGFWSVLDTELDIQPAGIVGFQRAINLPRRLMLVNTEIAETMAARNQLLEYTSAGKPLGWVIEEADVVIRLADIVGGYLAAGFRAYAWITDTEQHSIAAMIARCDSEHLSLCELCILITAEACELDRRGKSALPVLFHGLDQCLRRFPHVHPFIQMKMRWNATRPVKHGCAY